MRLFGTSPLTPRHGLRVAAAATMLLTAAVARGDAPDVPGAAARAELDARQAQERLDRRRAEPLQLSPRDRAGRDAARLDRQRRTADRLRQHSLQEEQRYRLGIEDARRRHDAMRDRGRD